MATPKELHQVYMTISSIVPGAEPPPELHADRWRSTKPEPLFRLHAGLFSLSAEGLCDPVGDTFDALVDRQLCREHLRQFCEHLRDTMPNCPNVKQADRAYDECMKRVSESDGITIPLLSGPDDAGVSFPWSRREEAEAESEDFKTLEQLEREIALEEGDHDVDFCKTVADCDLLREMRPWNVAMAAAFGTAVALVVVANILFLVHCVQPSSSKTGSAGIIALMVALALLHVVGGLYIYIDGKYPVQTLVRTEDLFYFILPTHAEDFGRASEDAAASGASSLSELAGSELRGRRGEPQSGDHETAEWMAVRPSGGLSLRSRRRKRSGFSARARSLARLSAAAEGGLRRYRAAPVASLAPLAPLGSAVAGGRSRAVAASPLAGQQLGIPHARWKGVLLTLTGNLLDSVASGDMSKFFQLFSDALGRAMSVAQVVFKKWCQYMDKSLSGVEGSAGSVAGRSLGLLASGLKTGREGLEAVARSCAGGGRSCEDSMLALSTEFGDLETAALAHDQSMQQFMKSCSTTIRAALSVWEQVKGPVLEIINRIGKAFKGDVSAEGAAAAAKDILMDEATVKGVQMVFQHLFLSLPQLVGKLLLYGRHLSELGAQMKAFFLNVAEVSSKATRVLSEVGTEASGEVLADVRARQGQFGGDVLRPAASSWVGVESAEAVMLGGEAVDGSGALLERQGTLALADMLWDANGGGLGLLGILQPFVSGKISCVAAKVGSIFLHEIELMDPERGLRTERQWGAPCSPERPGACAHLGAAFYALALVAACLAASSLGFLLGKL